MLEELSFNAGRTFQGTSIVRDPVVPAVKVIYKSPALERLHILLPTEREIQRELLIAVAHLDRLEELYLWTEGSAFSLQPLIEYQQAGDDQAASANTMWPALKTIGVLVKGWPLWINSSMENELCEFLVMRFFLQKGCQRGEAKTRTEAALAAYEKVTQKVNKAQRKKLASQAKAAAAKSVYSGNFETHDGSSRETFSSVLPELVTNSEHYSGQRGRTFPNRLLDQLVVKYTDLDISKEYLSRRDFY